MRTFLFNVTPPYYYLTQINSNSLQLSSCWSVLKFFRLFENVLIKKKNQIQLRFAHTHDRPE